METLPLWTAGKLVFSQTLLVNLMINNLLWNLVGKTFLFFYSSHLYSFVNFINYGDRIILIDSQNYSVQTLTFGGSHEIFQSTLSHL